MDFVEKVKKDLEFGSRDGCYGQACRDCEYYVNESCSYHKTEVMRDALVVIESQQKEIERLKAENKRLKKENKDIQKSADEMCFQLYG